MKPIVDLNECLRDSPKFRETLEENEENIDHLEVKLDKLMKLCLGMVESGKAYVHAKSLFINGIWDLVGFFKDDTTVVTPLNRLINITTEILKYQSILFEQAQKTVVKNLNNFIKNDIRHVKETKHHFDKISNDLDVALNRNSQIPRVPRNKQNDSEEINNVLIATRSCFQHTALDYVHQISALQSKKRYEILDALLSLMHAYSTYFHQGSDLFQDVDPFLKQLGSTLSKLRDEEADLIKQLDSRHSLVTSGDVLPVVYSDPAKHNGIRLEGYLFKRTSNAFKTWNRRWFIVQNHQLVYRKRTRDENKTIMEEDLRLCSVKPINDSDRRFCFEVLSPSKNHILQADSEVAYQCWISSLQSGIGAALNQTMHDDRDETKRTNSSNHSVHRPSGQGSKQTNPVPKPPRAHQQILTIPGNEHCCDCNFAEPQWASINLGITLCIECSGIHRSMGVHISKVRSLTLDAWEPEILKVMAELGNTVVNKIYEANVDESVAVRATPDCSRATRESWIKAKYLNKAFVRPLLGTFADLTQDSPTEEGTKPARELPRRWSVRKMSRRRRTMHAAHDQELKPETDLEGSKNTRRFSAAPMVTIHDKSPLSIDTVSVSSLGSETKESVTSVESGVILKEQETDSDEKSSTLKYQEQNKDSLSLKSENLDAESSIKDDSMLKDVLIFGDSLDVSLPNTEGLDLDSADESSTPDDEDTTTQEEDISNLHPNLLLYRAAAAHNLPVMMLALANGGFSNWINPDDGGKAPLHQAIYSGSIMACEFLLLNGAKCNVTDYDGHTALHLATILGNTGQVCLLLKRGVDQHLVDKDNKSALMVAMEKANADIVTLLRLAKLNEEIRKDEFGTSGDDTFNEVVRDFSHMAYHNPEMLRRPPNNTTE